MLSGLTYNVYLGLHLDELLTWLYKENELLDFYCFQEFPEQQISELKVYLDRLGYDFQFAPGFVRYGITYGELTAFKKSKLKLLKTETISLGGKGKRNIVFTHNGLKLFRVDETEIDKSALLTCFQYQDHTFSLVNTHLSTDIHNTRKLKQLAVIRKTLSKGKEAVILGDFNYAVGSKMLTKVMQSDGFINGLRDQKTFRFSSRIAWQNDYIFYRSCKVEDTAIKDVSFSDHYPIFFKVAFSNM